MQILLKKLMKAGETFVVDDGSALYLSTGNAGGIELVADGNNIISIGAIGEIVRDLPLEKNRLRERFQHDHLEDIIFLKGNRKAFG